MLAGQFGNEVGRDLRGIGEWLIEPVRETWNDLERMSRLNIKLGMIGAEMGGDLLRTLGFIIAAFVKADGEALHRPRALRLHQRYHRRRIDPPGQECAERDVSNHP